MKFRLNILTQTYAQSAFDNSPEKLIRFRLQANLIKMASEFRFHFSSQFQFDSTCIDQLRLNISDIAY